MTPLEAKKARRRERRREMAETVIVENGAPMRVSVRTPAQERRHSRAMDRWARAYDERNGMPEGDWDR